MPPDEATRWIERLGLEPHPEGGFFRETHRAALVLPGEALPPGFAGPRAASTAIYFLLRRGQRSALHRLRSDEVWHHYAGGPLLVHVLETGGVGARAIRLGRDFDAGETLQAVVSAGAWFGAELAPVTPAADFALVGCTVAPGFDFADFELARRPDLVARFPAHRELIERLTPEP
jgi:predicted cupin superfamily sugar epimerase